MEAEDRIRRMERDGRLTGRQAEQLRASVRQPDPYRGAQRRTWPLWPLVLIAAALAGVVIIQLSPEGVQPVQDVSRTLNEAGAVGAMNKTFLNVVAAALLVFIPVLLLALIYNGLVNREEGVYKNWAQVESQFQRRSDLIPALMETVSAYIRHERETLTEVTAARGGSLSRAVDELVQRQAQLAGLLEDHGGVLDDQARMDQIARAQEELGQRVTGFLALAEDYPELRASDQFLELQAQLEGTENRINVARMQFNESVGKFNAAIRRLPGALVAGLGNFHRKAYFKSQESAARAPDIELD
jgi:LemA protein